MPELPEIDHLRRSLEPILAGAIVRRVQLLRPDVLRAGPPRRRAAAGLLQGRRIECLSRRGKELALVAEDGRSVCVHLGMSGQLLYRAAGRALARSDHVHCVWRIQTRRGAGRLVFRDPRRFGGLWSFESPDDLLSARWARLGPDALSISARVLRERLGRTRRAVKAALLDQRLVAGIGNIYADEILFSARVHPASPACLIPAERCSPMAQAVRRVLERAIAAGGSTIRDYVDGQGASGSFARRHRVYGRAGRACVRCRGMLESTRFAQRTTVFCPRCQTLYPGG